jgi:release factor glutamine methyltransferase
MNYKAFEDLKTQFPSLSWVNIQRIMKNRPENQWSSDAQAITEGTLWEYLCGVADFGPISLDISPPLLIPRHETWEWLEQAYRTIGPVSRILDLGCGPGTLGLGWHHLQTTPWDLTAIDCHSTAVTIASKNFRKAALPHWKCYKSDWLSQVPHQSFDLILSNPPYCDPSHISFIEKSPEDPQARFSKHGGLQPYVQIFEQATKFLSSLGQIVVEHGADQGLAILRIGVFFGLYYKNHYHDQGGAWRATHFQVCPF